MKYSARGKIILKSFLRWIRYNGAAITVITGMILLFGAAGSMDYAAATGGADGSGMILAVLGSVMMIVGFLYGKRKGLRKQNKKADRSLRRLAG